MQEKFYTYEEILYFYYDFLSQDNNIYNNPKLLNNETIVEKLYKFFNYKKIENKKQEFSMFIRITQHYYKLWKIISVDTKIAKTKDKTILFWLRHSIKTMFEKNLNEYEIIRLIEEQMQENKLTEDYIIEIKKKLIEYIKILKKNKIKV